MTSAHESISENKAERLLASLAGVVSAHVVTDARARIAEIHILSAAGIHPKQVVRNIESALSAGLGIEIDRRIVSVAQIRTPEGEGGNGNGHAPDQTTDVTDGGAAAGAANGAAASMARARNAAAAATGGSASARVRPPLGPARLEYVRFASRRDAEKCACEVTLRDGDREVVGSGAGPDTAAGRAEAAARAVLSAIEQARTELRLQLDGAAISASRGRSFVIVSARAVLQRMTVPLAGAAPLARSPEEAGILATLQATNRWSG
jgi:hypothetical protein